MVSARLFKSLRKMGQSCMMATRAPRSPSTSSLFTNLSTQFRSRRYASVAAFEKLVQTRCKSRDLSVTEALCYSNSILEMETMPSIWTLNNLLESLSKLRQFSSVVSMYTRLVRFRSADFDPNVFTLTIVVKCLCRSRNTKSGFSVLGTMVKSGIRYNQHTLNALLDGLFKEGSTSAAMELFDRIKPEQDLCDEATYGIVANGLCKAGEPQKALELLQEMLDGDGTKPNAYCFSSVIDCLCKDGLILEALSLFQNMIDCGVRPNVVSYNSLINGLSRLGKWEEVSRVLKHMKGHRVSPDIITFNSILDARFKEGNTMAALHLAGVMAEKRIWPKIVASSSFLGCLSSDSRSEEAKILCESVGSVRIVANIHALNVLLNGLSFGFMVLEARELFEAMVDCGQVDTVTFTTMINGYFMRGEVDKAIGVFGRMEMNGVFPDIVTYNILAKGYLKVGRVDDALKILKVLILKGFRPDKTMRSILKMIHACKHEAESNNYQQGYDKEVDTMV